MSSSARNSAVDVTAERNPRRLMRNVPAGLARLAALLLRALAAFVFLVAVLGQTLSSVAAAIGRWSLVEAAMPGWASPPLPVRR